MKIEDLIARLDFDENRKDSERRDAEFYIRTKGIALHLQVAEHLGHDLSREGERISWQKLSAMLRYDKKLRDRLYIYIATLEEYIRACISNRYDDDSDQEFWIDEKNTWDKKKSIKKRIADGEKVSDVLNDIVLRQLVRQVKNLPEADKKDFFDVDSSLVDRNLSAVVQLRNAFGHHRFLPEYKFARCVVEGEESDSLENNIKNLRQLLPIEYRFGKDGNGGITADINKCRFEQKATDGKNETVTMDLPPKDVIVLS